MDRPPKRRRWTSAVRLCAYSAAILGALLTAVALILPDLLDTPRVRTEIQRILSEAVGGEVAWEALSIRILPSPHGALRKARLEIPAVASVSAEEARAYLRLWPLLRGRAEITSVSVTRPAIRVEVVPAPAVKKKPTVTEPAGDIFESYRTAMRPVVDAVRRYAPDTAVAIEDGQLEVHVPDTPPIRLNKVWLRVRTGTAGMGLEATAASPYWSGLTISARVEYADLSAKATLSGTNIAPQAWIERYLGTLPVGLFMAPLRVEANARTDARTALECAIDARTDRVGIARGGERVEVPGVEVKGSVTAGAQETVVGVKDIRLGASRVTGGELRYSAKSGVLAGQAGYDLDLAQGMDYTRRLVPAGARAVLDGFESVTGRAHGRVKLDFGRARWSVGVDVERSDASVQLRDLPGPMRLTGGHVEVSEDALKVSRAAVSMPAGNVVLSTLHHAFKDSKTAGGGEFDLDLPSTMELVRRVLPEKDRDALSVIESVSGRAAGAVKVAFARETWNADVDISKADAQVQVRGLPGPAGLSAASIRISPAVVDVERAALTLLDAAATASATVSDFRDGPRVRGSVAEAVIGENFLEWAWQLGNAPPHLKLKAPVRAAAKSFAWGPKQALEVQATAGFDNGPNVAIDLGWTPSALEVRRAAIKDERSDAQLSARIAGSRMEGGFSGSLGFSSIAAMLRNGGTRAGRMIGDFRIAVDRADARRTSAEGKLSGESLDLALLIREPVKVERIDLSVHGDTLRVSEATVDWAGQRATLRGEVTRGEGPPVIHAQLESSGINVDALRGIGSTGTAEIPVAKPVPAKTSPATAEKTARIWPLPVTGRVAVRSEFIQSGRHKVAPLAATVTLEERRARVDLTQAELCGISLPLVLEATPQGYSVSARVAAQKQQLEQSAHCLSGEGVLISGLYDLNADINTQGGPAELLHNLRGTVRAEASDGKVMKFAMLGNILSMGNVASLMKPDGPKLDAQGFPYRKLIIAGRFEKGRFLVDEGAFHSDALGLAANGWIALDKPESRLTVLVAPFSRLDQLVRKVPLVGYIIGGAFTSVPVGVSGDIRNPLVVPLGPAAVGSEVLGIFERTLKLPVKLVAPLEEAAKPATQPSAN